MIGRITPYSLRAYHAQQVATTEGACQVWGAWASDISILAVAHEQGPGELFTAPDQLEIVGV